MNVKDLLVDAKNLINIEGWTQGSLRDPKGYCSIGALVKIASVEVDFDYSGDYTPKEEEDCKNANVYLSAIEALCDAIPSEKKTGHFTNAIVNYNDRRNRTKQDVLDLFDRAIVNVAADDS